MTFLLVLLLVLSIQRFRPKRDALVLVLGDFGHSPRMQLHTESLLKAGLLVSVIGYAGSTPRAFLLNHPSLNIHYLKAPPSITRSKWAAIWARLEQLFHLFGLLILLPPHRVYLVQNPPAIPSFMVVRMISWIFGAKMIIDWHNLGYSLLSLTQSPTSIMVRFCEWTEKVIGALADAHIAVTRAMSQFLISEWHFKRSVTVLYDKSPAHFHRLSSKERIQFLKSLPFHWDKRSKLIVSSTSWTADEDFSLLLNAANVYDKESGKDAPPLTIVITGKGPLQKHYENLIQSRDFKKIKFYMTWLPIEDYPKLLGSADLGVSLHLSSSGLDLPMKVVDMFGCGLPVCSVDYPTELIHEKNGLLFNNERELYQHWMKLFLQDGLLETLAVGAQEFQKIRWDQSWTRHVAHLFSSQH